MRKEILKINGESLIMHFPTNKFALRYWDAELPSLHDSISDEKNRMITFRTELRKNSGDGYSLMGKRYEYKFEYKYKDSIVERI